MDEELELTDGEEERRETGRIEAFSDGVFAIAVTLLILDLNIPDWSGKGPSLFESLVDLWPTYLAFLTSFATIGVMWINHHRMFTHIKRSDNMLLMLNGLLLLGVTVVPFPTKVLSRYLGHDPDAAVAAMFYSGLFVLIALFFNVLWRYGSEHDRLLGKKINRREVDAITRQYEYGALPYVLAFALAALGYWFPPLVIFSVLINLGLAIYFAIPSSTVASVRSRN